MIRRLHCDRRIDCVGGILRRCRRGAEQSHQTIAEIFIKRAAMRKNDIGHGREIPVEKLHDLLRRRMFRDASEAANVGKQNGDGLVDTAQFERVRVLEHLRDDILGPGTAV